MSITIRKLNNDGLDKFADFLYANRPIDRKNKKVIDHPAPREILFDPAYTEVLNQKIKTNKKNFANRFEIAKHYHNLLNNKLDPEEYNGQGLWSWLVLYHWDELTGKDILRAEQYIPIGGDPSNYIKRDRFEISQTADLEYRQAIKGWYVMYDIYKNDAVMCLADDPLTNQGSIIEDIASRQYIHFYRIIFDVIQDIYWDGSKFKKPNGKTALGATKAHPEYKGGLRRAISVIEKLMYIKDFSQLSKNDLRSLMGNEFK